MINLQYFIDITGTCPLVPDPRPVPGERFADISDCEYFYECQPDGTLVREKCESVMDECIISGFACIFDVYERVCMHPYEGFDCYGRCAGYMDLNAGRVSTKIEQEAQIDKLTNIEHSKAKKYMFDDGRKQKYAKKYAHKIKQDQIKSKVKQNDIMSKLFSNRSI